ncbi:MAG: TetR family transcriptional regulator, partial [Acidobacteriota bacterium]|nr:TetR family transcriptional regulator [Acidobacteriota bacterium]
MAGASIRAIARAAGCDPALIYYHFESKEAMFLALLDRKMPPVARELELLADP